MKSLFAKASWLGLAFLVLSSPMSGQLYPKPSSSPVLCDVDGCNPKGLKTYAYSSPILRHRGRYLDSTTVRELQAPIRTYRAYRAAIVPERDRIYMAIGATFASYRLSTFFASDLDKSLVSLSASNRQYPEKYLPFLSSVYPEKDRTWTTLVADGQDRLGANFDWDDRDYVYLPYTIFGWGIYKDTGELQFVKQYGGPLGGQGETTPNSIITVKEGARYYAILHTSGSAASSVYDVTTPDAATYVRDIPARFSSFAKAKLGGQQVTALVDNGTGEIKIYSASALITGAAPEKVISPSAGGRFTTVTSDNSQFFAGETGSDYTGQVVAIEGSTVTSMIASRTEIPGGPFEPRRISYSDGTLALTGMRANGKDVALFRVAGDVLQHVDLGRFMNAYYSGVRESGTYLYAYPGNAYSPDTAVVYKSGGKEYLLVSMMSLGDVYEIQASDGVAIEVNSNSWGTANPYSGGSGGPFYGDVISFATSSTSAPVTVAVDFGNPEAGGPNSTIVSTGSPLAHRYSGLRNSSAIKATKKVKITATADSSKTADTTVAMQVPVARIGVQSSSLLFTQPNASATAPLLYGQQFVDASDGSVESHYSSWTLDGVETRRLPNQPFDVGQCSADPHVLSLTARYGYYDSSFASRNNPDFSDSVENLQYVVKPFRAQIRIKSSDATTGVTYEPLVEVGTGAIAGNYGAAASFTWEILDASKQRIGEPVTTPGVTLGTKPPFTLAPSQLVQGHSVRLTVALGSAALIAAPSCLIDGMETAGQTLELKVPDPSIAVASGQCDNVGSPCSVVATSPAGQDLTAWSYSWYLKNPSNVEKKAFAGTGPSFATYTPASSDVSLAGNYSVRLEVRNEAGITASSSAVTFNLAPSLCSGKPTADISISYRGLSTGCTSNCTSSETIEFTPYAWGYTFQDCDQFLWKFGDGQTSPERAPKHKYAANDTYSVTLTVTNNAPGTNPPPVALTLRLGTVAPPPPPPPPPCSAPSSMLGFGYSGPTSSCSAAPGAPSCVTGERVSFQAQNYPSSTFQTCDRFSWDFGDGSTSTAQNPGKTWSAAGTYRVTMTVSNTAGSQTAVTNVKVAQGSGGGDPSCSKPSEMSYVTYSGLSSGCTAGGKSCNPGETIRLTATVWQGTFQDCDRFDWGFGDGTAAVTNRTSKTIDHVFGGAQLEYLVNLTVKNTAGSVTVTEKVKFVGEPIEKPTSVDFTFPGSTHVVGTPVRFTATATAPAAHPVTSWAWNFGDGVTKSGNPVEHTFSTEDTWNVTLTASNAGGAAAPITKQIKVLKANAFTYLLPVVSHLNGANGSKWRTDLQIYNGNVGEGDVELEFELTNVEGMKKNFTLSTSTLILEDFMGYFNDGDWTGQWANGWAGPVIIRGAATRDLQIWTRTYSVAASGVGTYGHLIPAVRIDGNQSFTAGETTLYLTGAAATDKYRTNLYLLNITAQPMPVTITAYEGQFGAAVGQLSKEVAPFQLTPISASTIDGIPNTKPFSLSIKGTSDGLIAYESVIDNGSSDPLYIPAISTADLGEEAMRHQVLPSVGHAGPWKSDVTIFNPDDQAIQFDLKFHKDSTGELLAEAKDQILPAKGLLQLDDIIWSHAMVPQITADAIGTLRIDVDSPLADQFVVVAQRNYSDSGTDRRFGQGILGVAATKPNVSAGKPAILPAVRSDQLYRSNVGVVNVGEVDANVTISLLDQNSGQTIGMYSTSLKPNESRILTDMIRFLHETADRGSIKVEVTNEASIWAFATIIDRTTSDPEYVPAIPLD